MIEHKSLPLTVKAMADDGTAELYAAVFGNVDRTEEVIEPGAFKNLDEFVRSGWVAVNHDWSELGIATIEAAEQDMVGLKLRIRFHSTDDAQECRTVVKERMDRGKAVKCSIGYRVTEDAQEQRDGKTVRVLKGIEIYEASIVNLPANPAAMVTSVKHWADELDAAYVALKEGRVLSETNRRRLKACRDRLKETHDELETMLAETEAPPPDPTPAGIDVRKSARCVLGDFLAHEARYPLTGV
jgi:uncharacterized protein